MIIGIDLGTTNSLVSYFSQSGPKLIPNSLGEFLTPSAVHLDDDEQVHIGSTARDHLLISPDRTAARFKSYMGTDRKTRLGSKEFGPVELSALVLRSLKSDAEQHLGQTVSNAIVSVPAYFNDVQRKATLAAAKIAGLKVDRLINEPTAAALAYGLKDKQAESTFLVVDLGGGTFDVTILEMFSGVMEVRASAGDAFLGGEDFTDKIVDLFLGKLSLSKGVLAAGDVARLRSLATEAKHALVSETEAEIVFRREGVAEKLSISQSEFDEIGKPLINRLRLPLQRAISDSKLKVDKIDRVILVGGATRMNMVHRSITRLFQRFPEHDLDPDHVVALGAAVQAGLVEQNQALEEMVMTDVCPFTLGYETSCEINDGQFEHGLFSPLIERNTTVPVSRSHDICALKPGQSRIDVSVYQGESPYVKDNIKIGSYTVKLPPKSTDYEAANLRFTYDNSGILEVIATVHSTGEKSRLIVNHTSANMSDEEIEKRFRDLEKIKLHPREEAQNASIVARLSALFENALGNRRHRISDLLVQFQTALASQHRREIERIRTIVLEQLVELEVDDVFE